jgi:transposase
LVERPDRRADHELKLVKRQMYGRAKLDLLEARLIGTI